ncbi:biotin/lipoyl-binding protein [Candidatus Absconditicoccus praedator]|uniref:HlyD family efflux transporter periplasmic adaptor subunit n=1 Tax=Candidatus Absconditicoccus praedator TaxID=2735562 RepID=UPI001E2D2694|nr:biotin/lipoyl-binding protein [Candidatus Absconditicoccus praedator]UFX82901.1 HlyD family efflux transporter periplasmic adaptor subunit [Candidatus Absconditicoccus praedator]
MRKAILAILLVTVLGLYGCEDGEEDIEEEQRPYSIDTQKIQDFDSEAYFKKNGRVQSAKDIEKGSQVAGRVSSINVKEGDQVTQGQTLLEMEDSVANYRLQQQLAQNNLRQAEIEYEQTQRQLDKNLRDLQRGIEQSELDYQSADLEKRQTQSDLEKNIRSLERAKRQAKLDYEITQQDFEKQVEQLEYERSLRDMQADSSIARRELENLEKELENARDELESLETNNQQQINSFSTNIENVYDDYLSLVDEINYEADKLLGVTSENRNYNNRFDTYLGAKSNSTRIRAENKLRESIRKYENLEEQDFDDLSQENIQGKVQDLVDGLVQTRDMLDEIESTLRNSITSSSFTQTEIDGYKEQFGGYRTSIGSTLSETRTLRDEVDSFFENYIREERILKRDIERMESEKGILQDELDQADYDLGVEYERLLLQQKEALENAEIALENAIDDLEQAKQDKEYTMESLENSIENAQIGLEGAEDDYQQAQEDLDLDIEAARAAMNSARIEYQEATDAVNDLTVQAPIDGKIGQVHVNEGQEISEGDILFEISGKAENEIRISFREREMDYVREGMDVEILHQGESYIGKLYSISQTADENLNYSARVRLQEEIPRLGDFVTVLVFVDMKHPIIPVNILSNVQDNKANINIYENGELRQKEVEIQQVVGKGVLLKTPIEEGTKIITSNVRGYNEEDFYLQKQ